MRRPGPPLFLAKAGYRRRRLHDAARLVPLFGAFLVFLPILWAPAETVQRDTGSDGMYLFGVWFGLIAIAALLAPGLSRNASPDPQPSDTGDPT